MPRSLDPNSRLTIVLASDLDKPEDTQPRFFAMHLTANQQRKLAGSMERMQTAGTGDKIQAAIDAAMICLVGWENMTDPTTGKPILFGPDTLGDVLSIEELTEVIGFVASVATATAEDKKKLESPHSSGAANSANPVSESVGQSSVTNNQQK